MLKRYEVAFGHDEWGMVISCDTPSQAEELCRVFQNHYGELDHLEIHLDGELIKKIEPVRRDKQLHMIFADAICRVIPGLDYTMDLDDETIYFYTASMLRDGFAIEYESYTGLNDEFHLAITVFHLTEEDASVRTILGYELPRKHPAFNDHQRNCPTTQKLIAPC